MSHAGQGNPQDGASTSLFRNPEKPDSEAGTPLAPKISRLPVAIHQRSLSSKSGFNVAPKSQGYPNPNAYSIPLYRKPPTLSGTNAEGVNAIGSTLRGRLTAEQGSAAPRKTKNDVTSDALSMFTGRQAPSLTRPSKKREHESGSSLSTLRRRNTQGQHPNDDSDVTSGTTGPPPTLVAATIGLRAPLWKHRRQLAARARGRPVTSGPPKANRFPTTGERGPHHWRIPSTSSPDVAEGPLLLPVLEEPNPSRASVQNVTGRVTFVQVWTLCIVAAASLALPLGLLILSYLLTPESDLGSMSLDPPSPPTLGSGITSTKASFTLPARHSLPTGDPWAGVPVSCRRVPQIDDDVRSVSPQTPIRLATTRRHDFFCLYNNTKFFRGANVDFLPQNLPLAFCKYVVYWSFGISNGVPFSRTPQFDEQYGLKKLRYTVNKSGIPAVKIVLALGGYSSDHSQFSLMGRDSGALSRFVRGTMELIKSHTLDGVVIHWREPEPGCRSQADQDASALNAVFLALRRIFQLNGFPGHLSVIVPTQVSSTDAIVGKVVDVVDYVFLDLRQLRPPSLPTYAFCGPLTLRIVKQIVDSPSYYGNEGKFCPVLSVAPWLVEATPGSSGSALPTLTGLSPASQLGGDPGVGSALSMCGPPKPCKVPKAAPSDQRECLSVGGAASLHRLLVHMFHSEAALRDIFYRGLPVNFNARCALLYDLDLDNYARQCPQYFRDYWLIRYLYASLAGTGSTFVDKSMTSC